MDRKNYDYAYARNLGERKKKAKAHMTANIVLAIFATAAFFFFAIFAYTAIDAYIASQSFDGNGINGDGIGYAFAFVLALVATFFVLPLSLACAVSSGVAVKIRDGAAEVISRITLILSVGYIAVDAITMLVIFFLGRA